MQIGWIDFSKEDRRKVLSVIDLLSDDGTLDELGIAPIRDGFANMFFPGTSTIQTRAKYFFIVPYALDSILHSSNAPSQGILEKMDQVERQCAMILSDLHVDGVIGSRSLNAGGWVKRTPAEVYWSGLRQYQIFQGGAMSINEYVRTAVALKKSRQDLKKLGNSNDDMDLEADDGDAGGLFNKHFWKLPVYDRDHWMENLKMELRREEAEFLKEQIMASQPDSYLAHILRSNMKGVLDISSFHALEALISDFPQEMQVTYHLASAFSEFIYLARIRYNMILSKGMNQKAVEQWDIYEPALARYADIDLEAIFRILDIDGRSLSVFLLQLRELFRQGEIAEADRLIITREVSLKGVSRAKLNLPGKYPADNWLSGGRLDYRFGNAMILLRDIFDGLEED